MSFIGLKFLILAQIGIDIIIIIIFLLLIRRFRYLNKGKSFDNIVTIFESLFTDAYKITGQFKEQLQEKHHSIKRLNEQLDKRIISLNVLLNRADVLLSRRRQTADSNDKPISLDSQQTEIMALAKEGHGVEEIATTLSIPKGEVKLVLDLKKKFSQIGSKEN
jgi:DNA-binding NarL/FixJ family response regulator